MEVEKTKVSHPEKNKTTKDLLLSYLDGAVALTVGKSKAESKRLIEEYHKNADKKALTEASDALNVINAEKDQLKDRASSYGLKTKTNYASDADIADVSDTVAFGMVGIAASMLAPIAANDPNALSATMLAAAATYTAVKGGKILAAELSASKTPNEEKQAQDYANVKHAQLALKLLKKEVEAPIKAAEKAKRKEEINKLFAAGYGQPSGGLVQAAMLNKQKTGR